MHWPAQVWYGHPLLTTLVLDTPMPAGAENDAPVERRGWCLFERALSSLTKNSMCCLALSQLPPEGDAHFLPHQENKGGTSVALSPEPERI